MTSRTLPQALAEFCEDRRRPLILALAILALLLTGCASGIRIGGKPSVVEECPTRSKPVVWTYVNTPNPAKFCTQFQAPWGACTTCINAGEYRYCTTYAGGKPNEIGPDVLADEAGHALQCVHERRVG